MWREKSQRSCLGHGTMAPNLLALLKDPGNKCRTFLYHEDQEQILLASVPAGNIGETNGIGWETEFIGDMPLRLHFPS